MNVVGHDALEEIYTAYRRETDTRVARRVQGVYLAARGKSCPEIMEITGAKRRTVQKWVAAYNQGGLAALPDKPRCGAPRKLTPQQEAQLAEWIEAGPGEDEGISAFSGPVLQRRIEREFGQVYALSGLYDMLHRLGYSYLCPRPTHEKSDPKAQEAFKKTSLRSWSQSPPSIPTNG